MNWQLIGTLFLVLLIILIIAATLILYIRHWASRTQTLSGQLPAHEGNFFVRYIPPSLQDVRSDQLTSAQNRHRQQNQWLQYTLSTLVILGITGLLAATTYLNRDKLAARIDLTEAELLALHADEHTWSTQEIQKLPSLDKELAPFKKQGIIMLSDSGNEPWPHNGKNLTARARDHWIDFTSQHQLSVVECSWADFRKCHQEHPEWLYLVLPGHWYKESISELLDLGSKIIIYGPPRQIFGSTENSFTLGTLEFSATTTPDLPELALVADQELTLGFDAGLVVEAQASFKDYHASSLQPQGINISLDHQSGGKVFTRLFAEARGKTGRLVWMDFSPNPVDHGMDMNQHHFDGIMAAIFRYLNAAPYSAFANWPAGAHFAALMEEDTEDQFHNAERVARFFKEKNYPITWYMLSDDAQNHRDLTRLLAKTGEVACHGDNHQNFSLNDLQTQNIRLARCKKVIEEITGKPVLTFRPPEEKHNSDTLSAIANNGMTHFIAKNGGDRFSPVFYVTHDRQYDLVSIPRMNTDDYALWEDYKLADGESIRLLERETDWIKQVGGLLMFSFHTQYMGDDHYFNTVKTLADYIGKSDAYFATAGDIANWWRLRKKLLNDQPANTHELEKYQPVYLTVDDSGHIRREIITDSNKLAQFNVKEPQ